MIRESRAFRIILYILFIISIITYVKIYIIDEQINVNNDLPSKINGLVWYSEEDGSTLEFVNGKIKSSDKKLDNCDYNYILDSNKIYLKCLNIDYKVLDINSYRMIISYDNSKTTVTKKYYKYKEIIDYMKENKLKDISEDEINKIINIKNKISDVDYKSAQISKLTAINQLSIDEYINLKMNDKNAIVLILNKNMSVNSYNFIPIFISWMNKYSQYSYYYVDGNNININDEEILKNIDDNNKDLKDYLISDYDLNILIIRNEEYKVFNISLLDNYDMNKVFNCNYDECDLYKLRIINEDNEYDNIEEIIGNVD